jgi:putative nucleotidyltransferase with HDIG domain
LGCTLILTDDVSRSERILRSVDVGARPVLHDLYADDDPMPGAALIISDVSATTSESVRRLRRALTAARGPRTPLLILIHGNLGRGEIQATALGATRTLPASAAGSSLSQLVASMTARPRPAAPCIDLQHQAKEARAAFAAIFRGDRAPSPSLVDAGTALVDRAIRESKVRDWLSVVAAFDDVTHRHCLAVAGLAAAFAQDLGLNDSDSHRLTKGALLHDIGKAQVPIAILNKPAPLTPEERQIMDRHPAFGHAMLCREGYDAMTLAVVRSHHEYLDGSGYPDGLRAAEIPDLVRLITICDIYAALMEARPYKHPKSAREAFAILERMGTKLDGDLVRAFGRVAVACEALPERASA